MKISSLKSALQTKYLMDHPHGFFSLIFNHFRNDPDAAIIQNIEKFATQFPQDMDRDLTIEEELELGAVLYPGLMVALTSEQPHTFVNQLKIDLFTSEQEGKRDACQAGLVFLSLLGLQRDHLLTPANIAHIKKQPNCFGIGALIAELGKNFSDENVSLIVHANKNNIHPFIDAVKKLKEANIATPSVVMKLNESEKEKNALADAYLKLHKANILTEEAMDFINRCYHCKMNDAAEVLLQLQQADLLKEELGVFKLLKECDQIAFAYPIKEIVPVLRQMQSQGTFTKEGMDILLQAKRNCCVGSALQGLDQLKKAELFTPEIISLLRYLWPAQIASVIVLLKEVGLLQNNLHKLHASCYNYQLLHPLIELQKSGHLKQETLDLLWGLDPDHRGKTALLLSKAGLLTPHNIAAIQPLFHHSIDLARFNEKLASFGDALSQADFDANLPHVVIPVSEKEKKVHKPTSPMCSIAFIANVNKSSTKTTSHQKAASGHKRMFSI